MSRPPTHPWPLLERTGGGCSTRRLHAGSAGRRCGGSCQGHISVATHCTSRGCYEFEHLTATVHNSWESSSAATVHRTKIACS